MPSVPIVRTAAASQRTLWSAKWIVSHCFVIVMVVVMLNLGFWQLRRLDDRRADNDAVRAAHSAPAVAIEDLLDAADDAADTTAEPDDAAGPVDHTPVIASGTYQDELTFVVANRSYDSRPGYWLATPLRLADERLVVVARGWVPRTWVAGDDERRVDTPERVQLSGRAFASLDGGRVGSDVNGLAVVNRVDLAAVERAIGADVAGIWVQLAEQSPAAGQLPIPVPPESLDDGPHLAYAFQWFFFSAGAVVVYALILRSRLRAHLRYADEPAAGPSVDRAAAAAGAADGSAADADSRAGDGPQA